MRILLLTSFCCLAAYCTTYAQGDFRKGYYITHQHDSISVLVDYRSGRASTKKLTYKENTTSKKKHFYPTEVLAYGFIDGKRFVSKSIGDPTKGQKVFMEHIVAGRMSLYRYTSSYYVEKDSLYHLRQSISRTTIVKDKKTIITNKPYIGILNHLLFDCQLNANETAYDERRLTNIILNYNRCKNIKPTLYKAKIPKTAIHWQIFSGTDITQLKIEGLPSNTFSKSISPVFGASLDLSAPRIFDRVFLNFDVLYTDKLFQGYQEVTSAQDESITRYDYFINADFLRFSLGGRYNFFSDAQTPYIKGGIAGYRLNSFSMKANVEKEAKNGTVLTDEFQVPAFTQRQVGLWASVGFNKILYRGYKGFIEGRYEKASGFIGHETIPGSSSTETMSIIVGVRF
jgi:hypothetical protein